MSDLPIDSKQQWYSGGLRFTCTSCGNCCTGPPGAVWVTIEETKAMASKLGVQADVFLRTHVRRIGSRLSLTEQLTEYGHDCVFLDRQSIPGKAICGVYEARPVQCRTWPFWPENLLDRQAWDQARHDTPCPGMGHGRHHSAEQILVQLTRSIQSEDSA